MLSVEQVSHLQAALEPIYEALDCHEPWRESVCDRWSKYALPVARAALRHTGLDLGVRVYYPSYKVRQRLSLPHTYHQFIADRSPGAADPLIIDGTYLQFSDGPQAEDAAPHILVCPASHTQKYLDEAGINARLWPQWRLDLYGNKVYQSL